MGKRSVDSPSSPKELDVPLTFSVQIWHNFLTMTFKIREWLKEAGKLHARQEHHFALRTGPDSTSVSRQRALTTDAWEDTGENTQHPETTDQAGGLNGRNTM